MLEPRAEGVRDPDEGPEVFASADKIAVTCFLVRTDDSWASIGKYVSSDHPTLHVMVVADVDRFRKADQGGAIYYLSPDTFYRDRNWGSSEWTSRVVVKPVKNEIIESGLDCMIENGVVVYFSDPVTLSELRKNFADVLRAMRILKGMTSESEKRGLENPILKYC